MTDTPDPAAALGVVNRLPSADEGAGKATSYADMLARYRDFTAVFGTDQGQRVLRELLTWGHMFRPSFIPGGNIDPYRMAIHEGERNLALKLLGTLTRQPQLERPERTNTVKGDT